MRPSTFAVAALSLACVLPGAAQAETWNPGTSAGLNRVLGVLADERRNTLRACANVTGGFSNPITVQTALRAFDLAAGAATDTCPSPGRGPWSDIAVSADGTMYASDTTGGRILRLLPWAASVDVWVSTPRLRGVDGLSILDDGALYATNGVTGALFRIPVYPEGEAAPIETIATPDAFSCPVGVKDAALVTQVCETALVPIRRQKAVPDDESSADDSSSPPAWRIPPDDIERGNRDVPRV